MLYCLSARISIIIRPWQKLNRALLTLRLSHNREAPMILALSSEAAFLGRCCWVRVNTGAPLVEAGGGEDSLVLDNFGCFQLTNLGQNKARVDSKRYNP